MSGMISLVHHPLHAAVGELSPFVQHIHAIAEGSDLLIACPYLGLRVLRPIFRKAKSWRLLTDAEELLRSHAPLQRAELIKFLAGHEKQVHHWPGLHAKVVAGNKSALIGSANLTAEGLGKRQEMAVVLDDSTLVGQLRTWFDGLWNQCKPVPAAALESFAAALPRTLPHEAHHLESSVPQLSAAVIPENKTLEVASTKRRERLRKERMALPPLPRGQRAGPLVESGPAEGHPKTASRAFGARDEARLCERLANGVSREWVNAYLDMCADLLRSLEIPEDDARLCMSVPSSTKQILVHINQRCVLCAFRKGRKVIGMMLPRDFAVPVEMVPKMNKVRNHLDSFEAWRDEQPEKAPHFCYFEVEDPRELHPLRNAWLRAVLQETERPWKHSSHRRYHVPAFFGVVADQEYRRSMLAMAFSDS